MAPAAKRLTAHLDALDDLQPGRFTELELDFGLAPGVVVMAVLGDTLRRLVAPPRCAAAVAVALCLLNALPRFAAVAPPHSAPTISAALTAALAAALAAALERAIAVVTRPHV